MIKAVPEQEPEKVNILLVDDRPDGLLTLEAVLQCPEYNLISAVSGREALGYLDHYNFAVVLLDVQMPDLDGFETARLMKQHKGCANLPVIFITAINKDLEHVYEGYEAGAVDYLFKPFDASILRSKVSIFVELYKKNKKIEEQSKLLLQKTLELSVTNETLRYEMEQRVRAQREILEVSGREQKRIGQDLHDGLAQSLAALALLGKVLAQKLASKNLAEETQDALELVDMSKKGIDEAKSLSRGFYPIELERSGFFPAIKDLIINTERIFGISCRFDFDEAIEITDESVATHVYRILQESIHNSIKHGKCKHVTISIFGSKDAITFSVQDDGVGMNKSKSNEGMGLRIMSYRAKMIGATLSINEAREGGTVMVCKLPRDYNSHFQTAETSSNGFHS